MVDRRLDNGDALLRARRETPKNDDRQSDEANAKLAATKPTCKPFAIPDGWHLFGGYLGEPLG